ncbi:MAG TPA: hypothetical protein VM621_08350 [Luteibacter sp.]|uniref:hypothetical protein n=1 Tax=Luteibacter sp. TaxID=1886636 RepID=UPI002BE1B9C3|nr:hypothetical protein [Luteibacter sp.]HVI55048.1 hypothetical protein [Luteibacter sp.]
MQITSSVPSVVAHTAPRAMTEKAVEAPGDIKTARKSAPDVIDFSNVTPRQLRAYLDDRLMSGRVDGPDGLYCTTLFGSIPGEWYTERADVPMDLTATIDSMTGFARGQGSAKLVSLYEGLNDWMKMVEAQAKSLSVMA